MVFYFTINLSFLPMKIHVCTGSNANCAVALVLLQRKAYSKGRKESLLSVDEFM